MNLKLPRFSSPTHELFLLGGCHHTNLSAIWIVCFPCNCHGTVFKRNGIRAGANLSRNLSCSVCLLHSLESRSVCGCSNNLRLSTWPFLHGMLEMIMAQERCEPFSCSVD